ncbi:hypothetical protein [Gilvimarinus sp. DA14]|uniref:hypothetical protein n=1 Tax=Gilvimarinus sp. DA14 TaxID=2956798 RepID=UPI0020B63E6F|nr:hypothetical protein [Gilvimarinus sp. DA14]UTF60272.1 hypothetical protein NHM04_00320 [Gilvimarinus sp. DA14]
MSESTTPIEGMNERELSGHLYDISSAGYSIHHLGSIIREMAEDADVDFRRLQGLAIAISEAGRKIAYDHQLVSMADYYEELAQKAGQYSQ